MLLFFFPVETKYDNNVIVLGKKQTNFFFSL